MLTLGEFPIYYTWMAYVLLTFGVAGGLSEVAFRPAQRFPAPVGILLLSAIVLGVPIQLASAVYYWRGRNVDQIESLVGRHVDDKDWVYAHYSSYFAVRKITPHVLMPYIIPRIYKDKVTVLVVSPETFAEYARGTVGGVWRDTGDGILARGHDLLPKSSFAILLQRRVDVRVYRRIDLHL